MRISTTPLIAVAVAGLLVSWGSVATAQDESVSTDAGEIKVHQKVSGLEHPWGLAVLPDGRLLVTERPGRLRIIDGDQKSEPLDGTPQVFSEGQGGLLDVALDPDFTNNSRVWLSFSEPGENGAASTALGHGTLEGNRIRDFTTVFSQEPKIQGPNHFGGRIVFSDDGTIFLALGERFQFDPAQDESNHLGTIVRLNPDGSAPDDNPFTGQANGRAEIWSYGHRNIEAAAIDPETGTLWVAEMGPLGGDELNRPEAGENYGWPTVSWGKHYNGSDIQDPPAEPRFADAEMQWTPVISPSGMIFYGGETFAEWQGSMLIGSLSDHGLVRVSADGEPREEERIPLGARIRDIEEAADGTLYVITDEEDGWLWQLAPL